MLDNSIDDLIRDANLLSEQTGSRVKFTRFSKEDELQAAIRLIEENLSEPYSIYTYRYFVNQWPQFFYLATIDGVCVGVIISKLESHSRSYDTLFGTKTSLRRGYIAMLVVDKKYRKLRIGYKLVQLTIKAMKLEQADEIVLEAEANNLSALNLYKSFGFLIDKSMKKYYYGGMTAYRLKLWLPNQNELEAVLKS